MANPDLVVELSSELLTRFMRNTVATLIACPSGDDLFTDVTVEEVVPLRRDDPLFLDPADMQDSFGPLEAAMRTAIDPGFSLPATETLTISTQAGPATIQVPSVFLIVSLTRRIFTASELDMAGSSDAAGSLQKLLRLPRPGFAAPLLFRFVQSKTTTGPEGVTFHFEFVTIFNTGLLATHANDIKALRIQLADIATTVPLGSVVGQLAGSAGIRNAGISTSFYPGDKDGPGPPGLRIGLDTSLPASADGWAGFAASAAWDLQAAESWGIIASDDFLVRSVSGTLSGALPTSGGGVDYGQPQTSWDGTKVATSVSVSKDGLGHVGDVIITLQPSLGTVAGVPALDWRVCADFSEDIGTAIGDVFLGIVGGAVIGGLAGPVGAIVGAVVGFVVTAGLDIAISVGGKGAAAGGLGGASLPPQCGPVKDSCRDCLTPVTTFLDGIGGLRLARVTGQRDGLVVAGILQPDLGVLAPGRLEIAAGDVGGWQHPWGTCAAPDANPSKRIVARNTGGLPLKICEVAQRNRVQDPPQPPVLKVRGGPEFGIEPVVLPGDSHVVTVTSAISGAPGFNPGTPLTLRILTSAGALELDLNQPQPATVEDPAEWRRFSALAQILCDLLTIPAPLWRQIAFTDPVPFLGTETVHERLEIFSARAGHLTVEGIGEVGPLARAHATEGTVGLSVAAPLPASTSHVFPALWLETGLPAETTPSPSTPNPSAGAQALGRGPREPGRSHDRTFTRRSLYVEGPWFVLREPAVAAAKVRGVLAVLTGSELRIATVGCGWLRWQARIPVDGGRALAAAGDQAVVATADEVLAFEPDGTPAWSLAGAAHAAAGFGPNLWITGRHGITRFCLDRGQPIPCQQTMLPDVTEIAATATGIFALSQDRVWDIGQRPRQLDLAAEHLLIVGCQPAAQQQGRVAVFDAAGRVHTEYTAPPWTAHLLEWPDTAVEVRRDPGLVVVHNRYETDVDATRLPDQILAQYGGTQGSPE